MEGTLSDGWVLTPGEMARQVHLLTDSEIFGWERPQPRRAHSRQPPPRRKPITPTCKPGDWVVHVDYGIGRYAGLVRRALEGAEREFLCVEYDGGDQIFVPVYQADRLSRYIGPAGEAPIADPPGQRRMGARSSRRVREVGAAGGPGTARAVCQAAGGQGPCLQPDTVWQQDLEASFPYMETEDQLRAIQEVKQDMESARPMDRLLCGDVGYGKTEVALRAAFKAVMDGKQVAILVPTTVLAQQHYRNLPAAAGGFPGRRWRCFRASARHKQQDEHHPAAGAGQRWISSSARTA